MTFVLALMLVGVLALALTPLQRRHPVSAAAAFGAIGSLLIIVADVVVSGRSEQSLWTAASKVVASSILWAGLAQVRIWHQRSKVRER
jgi:peptidoglycan/LPS O-acetylase OafA/YrhL